MTKNDRTDRKQDARRPYERPSIRSYSDEEILAQLGPAQLYTGAVPFGF